MNILCHSTGSCSWSSSASAAELKGLDQLSCNTKLSRPASKGGWSHMLTGTMISAREARWIIGRTLPRSSYLHAKQTQHCAFSMCIARWTIPRSVCRTAAAIIMMTGTPASSKTNQHGMLGKLMGASCYRQLRGKHCTAEAARRVLCEQLRKLAIVKILCHICRATASAA